MPRATLTELFERNRRHVDQLSETYFADVADGQRPPVVSLCCSDSRVSQEAMFDVSTPGWLFTPSNIGNVAFDEVDTDDVDGSLLYPVRHTDTRTVVVVGHTGCGAVTAAYDTVRTGDAPADPSIARRVEMLVPVVETGLDGPVDETAPRATVIDQLVEYNVREQTAFLDGHPSVEGEDVSVFGFVYDLHGRYGDVPGSVVLVSIGSEHGVDRLREFAPDEYEDGVRSLL